MSKKMKLKSSDGETFEVDEAVASEFQLIKDMIEMDCADGSIPLLNVTGAILARVIEYCKKHVESGSSSFTSTLATTATSSITEPSKSAEDELKAWDADFVKVNQNTLIELILAAKYLNIKSLLDLTCQILEDMIRGMTLVEICKTFNIKNEFTLKSSDGKTFKVDEAVAAESQTIKDMIMKHIIQLDCADGVIPLPNVTSTILARVIEYCKKHVESGSSSSTSTSLITKPLKYTKDKQLKAWEADFVRVDRNTLFDLILAAKCLNIKSLLDLTCQAVADMIKGKTPAKIRKMLNIKSDFTPEEEVEIRRERQWAYE